MLTEASVVKNYPVAQLVSSFSLVTSYLTDGWTTNSDKDDTVTKHLWQTFEQTISKCCHFAVKPVAALLQL